MQTLSTNQLMLIYLSWKMRLIRPAPRKLRIWSGGVAPAFLATMRSHIEPLAEKVERGDDLTLHLSSLVHTIGFAMPHVEAEKRRHEQDAVLTKTGLHHFHVGAVSESNPKGRSGRLVFADVTDHEFRIIAVSNHDAFDIGSEEWQRLFGLSRLYIQSQVPDGGAHMAYPVMSSGHSMDLFVYAMHCGELATRIDPLLDDRTYIDELYGSNSLENGDKLPRPRKPNFQWHFAERDFGVLETKSQVFLRFFFSPR